MGKIVSIHSFRGGTGKSNLTANVATTVALGGRRVGIIDTDIQSPGIHVLFGLGEEQMEPALNDYLWGRCRIEETAHDVSTALGGGNGRTRAFLIPSSVKTGEIARVLREGYDVSLLNDGLTTLIQKLDLDYLFIDTHPGVNEETLLSIASSDALVILLRPDQQDYQGTAVTVELARRLEVPRIFLVVNKALTEYDPEVIRAKVEATYQVPCAGVLPMTEDMLRLASGGLFTVQHPEHRFTSVVRSIAASIVASIQD
jgi:MinD-like ATPase involved in chromosome partitioning or flagellar assembly